MRIRKLPLIAGLAVAVSGTAMAGDDVVRGPYIAPMGGYHVWDEERNLEDSSGTYGIGLGYQFNSKYSAEFVYGRQNSETDPGNADVDGHVRRLDIIKHFSNRGRVQPFMLLGGGELDLDASGASSNDESFVNFGGGYRVNFNDNLSLRWDARAVRSLDENNTEFATNLALIYVFGEKVRTAPPPPPPPAPAPKAMPGDADGDGVLDDVDRCPDTPRNLRVDARGCPILVKQGVEVDLNVNFEFDKAVVLPQYYPRIEAVADFMKKYPGTSTTLEGHTDSTGPDAYNQGLSERRANAVRDIFINKFGIAPKRLQAVGYGESRPIADNGTKDGRAQNRRTTAVIKATRMEYKKR